MSDPQPGGDRSLIVAAAIAVGGLMATLCGGCTVYWIGLAVLGWNDPSNEGLSPILIIGAVAVGGLPTLLGVLLLRWAWPRWRGPRLPPSPPPPG